jgi:hypothetical protein
MRHQPNDLANMLHRPVEPAVVKGYSCDYLGVYSVPFSASSDVIFSVSFGEITCTFWEKL